MDIKQHESFHWHPQAQLCSPLNGGNDLQQIGSNKQHGIHYIVDTNCENTLRCLQKVLPTQQAFCVHSPDYSPSYSPTITNPKLIDPETMSQSGTHSPDIESTAYFHALSSGTNGRPKRIRRTHHSWIASFIINAQSAHITSSDSYALVGRLSHSLSLYAALEAVHIGANLHPLSDLRPDRQLEAIAALQSSILYATPTQLRLLCKHAKKIKSTELAVRHIFCGGGKLDQATAQHVGHVFSKATVQEFYGATETSFISITDKHTPTGSVGKAYPGVEITIGDTPNTPDINDTTRIGKIWVRSPYVFDSYVDQQTADVCMHNGYISVGELGYLDKNGYLFLTGRQSRRVNIADTVVYPEEIECVLLEHSAVSLCAVVPIEDNQRGCVLIAVVEATGSEQQKQALLVYLRQSVGPLKSPRKVVFIPRMPLLDSGKPDLMAVKKWLALQHDQP